MTDRIPDLLDRSTEQVVETVPLGCWQAGRFEEPAVRAEGMRHKVNADHVHRCGSELSESLFQSQGRVADRCLKLKPVEQLLGHELEVAVPMSRKR
jgi:hypothetical protein